MNENEEPSAPKGRRGGCTLRLVVLLVLALGVAWLVNPWSVHIGGAFTPLERWDGYGVGVSPNGSSYAVYLQIGPARGNRTHCINCSRVSGKGAICTAATTFSFRSASGTLHSLLSTDGAAMSISLGYGSGAARSFSIDLNGKWSGDTYLAGDGGEIAQHVTADGHYQPPPWTPPNPALAAAFPIRTGSQGAFRAACQRLAAGG